MLISLDNIGKAYLDFTLPGIYTITGVHATERGKGYGRKIMQAVCTWADARHIALELRCQPIGKTWGKNRVMNAAELAVFYAKFGFEGAGAFMTRAAR